MQFWKKLFLTFAISTLTYSYEEAYIQLKSREMRNDFYRVYYDSENDKLYLGINALVNYFRLRDVKVDMKSLKMKGKFDEEKRADKNLRTPGYFIEEDEIYVPMDELKEIFELDEVKWDEANFSLELNPSYQLSYEMEIEGYRNRMRLDNMRENEDSENYEKYPSRLISPGVVLLTYNNSSFTQGMSDHGFRIDYGTQFLYGNFEASQNIVPESNLNYLRLTYKDIWKSNTLILGDNFIQMDTPYSTEKNIRGVYFGKNEVYGYSENNETVIQGQIFNANTIELYRNNFLIDYQRVLGNNFQFRVPNIVQNETYTLKIFYNDGTVEIRPVNLIGSTTLLAKGENDYLLQGGKTIDGENAQYLLRYKRGITSNLTTGIGAGRLENRDGEIYDIVQGGFAYRLLFKYPTIFSGEYYRDIQNSQNGYKGKIDQSLGRDMSMYFEYEKYDTLMAIDKEFETSYSAGIDKLFPSIQLTGSLGMVREEYFSRKKDYTFFNVGYTGIKNTGLYLYNRYTSDINGRKGYGVTLQGNYYGFEYFDILTSAGYDFQLNSDEDLSSDEDFFSSDTKVGNFEVKIIKKIIPKKSILNDFDLDFRARYSTNNKFSFGLNFTYYLDKWVYVETPITYDKDGGMDVGIQVQKAIPLSQPLKQVSNYSVSDFWIQGTAFSDKNGNGVMDKGEKPIPNVGISVTNEKTITDENGKYVLMNLTAEGIHTLEVDGKTIDAMSLAAKDNFKFKGRASMGHTIDIPIVPVSVITGYVSADKNISEKDFIDLLIGVDIILKKQGKEIKRIRPESDGYYYFEGVGPGKYEIEIDIMSNSKKIYIDKKIIIEEVESNKEGDYYEENNFKILKVENI